MRRYKTSRRRDRRVFSSTASCFRCKKINLAPRIMRGGIRL